MSIVVTEDRGPVRHVVLNRPEKRNAMNQELLAALARRAARGRRRRRRCTAWSCAAKGPCSRRAWTSTELAALGRRGGQAAPVSQSVPRLRRTSAKRWPSRSICQIHRTCVGGALEVALGCDLRIASSDAQLGLPEVRFGIIPDVGGSTRLPAVVGLGRAKELIMTARMIDAAEAERIGLVNRVVAPEELEQATRRSWTSCSPTRRRRRPRQARDRRLGPPGARADAGDGGRGPGVLRRCASRARGRRAMQAETQRQAGAQRGAQRATAVARLGPASRPGRPRACGCRAAGRGSPARAARTRSARRRSMPVAMPISCSIETRSSVAMLPVAPAGTGQPPELAEARLEALHARLQRRQHVGEALPARVVEVRGQLQLPSPSDARGPRRRTPAPGAGWPCRSCRRSRSPARPRRAGARRSRAPARAATWPSYGQPNEVEITPSQRRPAARARQHDLQAGERLGDRAVDVLAVVGLRGRQEDVDLVERRPLARCLAQLERARRARARWGSAPTRSPPPARRSAPSTSAASASWGITSARTKLVDLQPLAGRCARARRSARSCARWG